MPCGWEGNRRSGVALAMRHKLQWFIHLRAHGLRKGDEHPAYTPRGVWHTLPFTPYPRLPHGMVYGTEGGSTYGLSGARSVTKPASAIRQFNFAITRRRETPTPYHGISHSATRHLPPLAIPHSGHRPLDPVSVLGNDHSFHEVT